MPNTYDNTSILAQYDAAFLLKCEMVDELLMYSIHNKERQLEELVAEKLNKNKKNEQVQPQELFITNTRDKISNLGCLGTG